MGILKERRTWGALAGLVVVLGIVCFLYLAAVISPQKNLSGLPIALVNEDRGGRVASKEVDLGKEIVDRLTGSHSPAGNVVEWVRLDTREGAIEGIRDDRFYGAVVIPRDYTARLAGIAGPPRVPLAIVDEDEGASLGGRRINFGREVVSRLVSRGPSAAKVQWREVDGLGAALRGFREGKYYAAVVIPPDYSKKLAGVSTSAAVGAGATPKAAEMELLTNPRVRPAVTAQIESAFSKIVDSVSGATRERVLRNVRKMGNNVPPGAVSAVADPVRGKISKAKVSGGAATLPAPPKPAKIEVLTNPASGQGGRIASNILLGLVSGVSRETGERLVKMAGEQGVSLPPELATVVGDPVRADVTEVVGVGKNSGAGGMPFFLAFFAGIAGVIGAAAVYTVPSRIPGGPVSSAGRWTAWLLLGAAFSGAFSAVEVAVAFGLLDAHRSVGVGEVYGFLVLCTSSMLFVTLVLARAFGYAGLVLSLIGNILLGLVSSGGFEPLQALPGAYQVYSEWLPMRHAVDGLRALLFYGGRMAAGLEGALWVLGAYALGAAVLGYAIAVARTEPSR
ncbi:MAG: ABC transporter permease [Rubrobacteraceae bacterium]|nr:ABC transporter permease [Rubrobacteraceae bacterium]